MLGRVIDTVLLVVFQSKIDKRAIASSSGMGNRIDSMDVSVWQRQRGPVQVGGGGGDSTQDGRYV